MLPHDLYSYRVCPGLTSWDILSRPSGTAQLISLTQDCVLGYCQPSPFDRLRAGSTGLIPVSVGRED